MQVNNVTAQDYWIGPLHLPANTNAINVDDTSATSLYLTDDSVADALNYLYASGKITIVAGTAAQPFPRPTGKPDVLHGDGSPEGLVYASPGSVYLRRDLGKVYQKTTMVHLNTGWAITSQFNESALKAGAYETMVRQCVSDDLSALATGQLILVAIDLPGDLLVNNLSFVSAGTAANTPVNQWFALYDQNLNKLAVTADDTTNAWNANALKTLAISGGFRTTYAGLHYVGVMVKATVVPTLAGFNGRGVVTGLAPKLAGASTTGLTTPSTAPNPAAALSSLGTVPYAYVS
jgi:hypothetical protein